MGTIPLKIHCAPCNGAGIRHYIPGPNMPEAEENPCSFCQGTGLMNSQFSLDSETLENIFDKVKKIKKTTDDIWDKVNV